MLLRRLSLLLALIWMAYIFYLSSQSSLHLPSLFPNQDKVMHFAAYAVLGLFILGALPLPPAGFSSAQLALATLLASLYGISDEIHQSFVPGRDPEVLDWLADTSGALTATLLLAWLSRRLVKQKAQPAA
jgi:VanZ family protein